MELKSGTQMRSGVCTTEIIVVKAPSVEVDLRCGGEPMHPKDGTAGGDGPLETRHNEGTKLGKRYADEEIGLELLCTKAGKGSLSLGDEPLPMKEAKPLPSSD